MRIKKKSVPDRIYEDPEGPYKEKYIILGYHVHVHGRKSRGGGGGNRGDMSLPHNFKDGGHNINCPPPPPHKFRNRTHVHNCNIITTPIIIISFSAQR